VSQGSREPAPGERRGPAVSPKIMATLRRYASTATNDYQPIDWSNEPVRKLVGFGLAERGRDCWGQHGFRLTEAAWRVLREAKPRVARYRRQLIRWSPE
jgi:hypothetical protein